MLRLAALLCLASSLLAQPEMSALTPSVRALLRKPRLGRARLTKNDGTVLDGEVVRVTNEFLAFRSGGSCQDIELAGIRDVKEHGTKKKEVAKTIAYIIWSPVLLPFLLEDLDTWNERHGPMFGVWESIHPLPDGRTSMLWIQQVILRRIVSIERGRYQVQGNQILLKFDPSAGRASADETVPIRFQCADIVIENRVLSPGPRAFRQANAPIAGRWNSSLTTNDSLTWDFRPDGTFQRETFTESQYEDGLIQRREEGKIHVQFRINQAPDHEEDWETRTHSDHLWITHDGHTEEYKRVADFD
jgi:hypothetical protein